MLREGWHEHVSIEECTGSPERLAYWSTCSPSRTVVVEPEKALQRRFVQPGASSWPANSARTRRRRVRRRRRTIRPRSRQSAARCRSTWAANVNACETPCPRLPPKLFRACFELLISSFVLCTGTVPAPAPGTFELYLSIPDWTSYRC